MEAFPEFFAGPDRREQWGSTAKLRRLEVERIEALLPKISGPPGWPRPDGI
jgi:hypothetical protein